MPRLLSALHVLPEWTCSEDPDVEVSGITDRSSDVTPGNLFVAIAGTAFDGHRVIADAIEAGAAAVVVQTSHRNEMPSHPPVPYVYVPNSRLALALLAKELMPGVAKALSSLTWIGVTGTNGKTTVATLVEQMLFQAGHRTAFIGTTGAGFRDDAGVLAAADLRYTTPHAQQLYTLAVEFQSCQVTHVVMEVSSHALHQHRVAGIPFHVALFTNLTRDHLDYHRSMEEYAAAKKMFFDGLGSGAIAIVNGNSPEADYMLRDCKAERMFQTMVHNAHLDANGARFRVDVRWHRSHENETARSLDVQSPLLGDFNTHNVGLAAAACVELGMEQHVVEQMVRTLKPPVGRMERIPLPSGATAVIDYAHTPDALENALQTLRPLTNRLIVVFGCGGDRDRGKRPQMGSIASKLADVIWLTSDNPRNEDPHNIIEEIRLGIPSSANVHEEPDRRSAIQAALLHASPGAIVLISGKGHEQYQEIAGTRVPFSDQEVVRQSSRSTGEGYS